MQTIDDSANYAYASRT